MPIWVYIAAGIVVLLALGYFFLLDHRSSVAIMEAEDGGDPLRRWARAAYVMINGKFDPGKNDSGTRSMAKDALARDWDIASGDQTRSMMAELFGVPNGNPAWDHVRRIVMARMAAGAGYISQEESLAAIAPSIQALQAVYGSWEELGAAYREALANWSNNDGDRMEMFDLYVKVESRPLWKVVPFR